MNISKIILVIILFIVFFEIGLFSSYTIVTSEVPDIGELITMQTDVIASIINPEKVGTLLIKDPTSINISNSIEVSESLSSKADIDGVDVDSMNITTNDDVGKGDNITVNITALGFSAPSSTSGQIIISSDPDYKVSATAKAVYTDSGYKVVIKTLKVTSILKMYDGTTSSNTKNSNSYSYGSSSSYKSGNSYGSSSYSSSNYGSNYNSNNNYGSNSGYDSGSSDDSSYNQQNQNTSY